MYTGTLFLGQVTHYGNFLDWLDLYFIPVLYNEILYNGEGSTNYDQKFISSPYHFRLGHPSMRQLRVKQGTYFGGCLVFVAKNKSVKDSKLLGLFWVCLVSIGYSIGFKTHGLFWYGFDGIDVVRTREIVLCSIYHQEVISICDLCEPNKKSSQLIMYGTCVTSRIHTMKSLHI